MEGTPEKTPAAEKLRPGGRGVLAEIVQVAPGGVDANCAEYGWPTGASARGVMLMPTCPWTVVRLKFVVTATLVPVICAVIGTTHGVHTILRIPDSAPPVVKVKPKPWT